MAGLITPIVVCIILLFQNCYGDFEPAYLKVCGKEHKHFVDSFQCDKGVWLRTPIEPGCICVRGVWAISNGFCDEEAAILVGDGNCFHIPFPVQTVKLIGDSKDPFKPKIFHLPKSLEAVFEVQEGSFTPPIQNDESIVIGVNPRQVAQRKDNKFCIDLDPADYSKPVHIFVNPRRSSKEWTLDKKKHFNCPTTTNYQHHVGFGEMFIKGRVEPKLMVQRKCQMECPGEGALKNRTIQQGRWLVRSNSAFRTIEERNEERDEVRAKFSEEPSRYEKELNEQTLRMMHAHISPILLNVDTRHIVTKDYRYFQKIRKVIEKACPQDYVPKLLVTGLMRMFRQLLWETQDGYFQHEEQGDEGRFDRIMERLNECIEKSPDPSVLFTTYTDSYKANSTPPMDEPKPERCPIPILFAVNGTQYNRTHLNDKESLFIRNYTNIFQPHLKFNGSQVDFVIETAWKIAMIGHYRCSKYFDGETAIEFSHVFHQIQSFFNPRIIKRWYSQASIDATLDVVKLIFPSYDLNKFMFGLDSCLFGIQGFSLFDYSNVWLQRPKIPMTANDLSQKKHVLPGSGSKLNTLDFAPDMPSFAERLKAMSQNRRKKRGAPTGEVSGYYLWNQQARCLQDYMDPVVRREFGYELPRGCTPPLIADYD